MKILIKDGHVVDPVNNIDGEMDILVEDGKIAAVSKNISGSGADIIDAKGKIVAPGFIDMHSHLQ